MHVRELCIYKLTTPHFNTIYCSTWNMDDAGSGFSFSIIGDLELHCDILNLNSWNLTGAIPESIGKLTNLTVLDFSNNQLEGKFFLLPPVNIDDLER